MKCFRCEKRIPYAGGKGELLFSRRKIILWVRSRRRGPPRVFVRSVLHPPPLLVGRGKGERRPSIKGVKCDGVEDVRRLQLRVKMKIVIENIRYKIESRASALVPRTSAYVKPFGPRRIEPRKAIVDPSLNSRNGRAHRV